MPWWPIGGDTEYRICDDMEVLRFFEAHKSDSLAELAELCAAMPVSGTGT